MIMFIIISLVIFSALFSAKYSLKDEDYPIIKGIITAPIFIGLKYLVTWGSFALVNLFTPIAYTPIIIFTFTVVTGAINLFLEVVVLYLEENVN